MTQNAMPGLVIDIEGRINKLEKSLKQANDKQRKAAAEMERRAKQSAEKIGDAYEGIGTRIGRAFEKMPAAMKGLGGAMLGGFPSAWTPENPYRPPVTRCGLPRTHRNGKTPAPTARQRGTDRSLGAGWFLVPLVLLAGAGPFGG